MKGSSWRSAVLTAFVAACALALWAVAPAGAAASPGGELKALVGQVRALPSGTVRPLVRRRLLTTAVLARRQARRSQCKAVRSLARFRATLRTVRVRRGAKQSRAARRLLALGPRSLRASRALLATRATRRCGGGVRPSRVRSATTRVVASDTRGFTAQVQLPEVRFVPRAGGGRQWTQLTLPDTDAPQAPGQPAIPLVATQFAVPEGATVTVDPGAVSSYTVDGVDLYPAQPDVVDQTPSTRRPDFSKPPFATAPFQFDAAAYRRAGPFPAQPASGAILGSVRDLVVGGLSIPAAQYDPRRRLVRVLRSVQVRVVFGGANTGRFAPELGSPWERAARSGLSDLVNASIIAPNIRDRLIHRPCGEELLIVTNSATRAAADTLKAARSRAGILTRVVEVGTGAGQIGSTAAEIQRYIRGRLTQLLCVHPSYVVLLGDDELVPTFTPTISGVQIPSDLPYSLRNDSDELPDVAVGRIIGNDQAQVQTAVDKIVAYENSAPAGDFLRHATIAAQFQDDDADGQENRTFVWFAERVRTGLVRRGVTVDRIYGDSPTATPLRFNDGTDLPAALRKPTFRWDGSGTDVQDAWNAGRFLMVHRDHGWSQGWGTPGYTAGSVAALRNGALLPVVLSINCSSGAYDYDESSFATTALTLRDGGAVGVFGDTRDSPSWHNSQIALGFVDGLLPSVLPDEGPAAKQRAGDALINGKVRLAGLADPSRDGASRQELYLWHWFGDPTMQMWGGGRPPFTIDPAILHAVFTREISGPRPGPDPPPYEVRLTLPRELAGQPIALLRNGEVVGKGVGGVVAPLFGDGSVKPGELQVAIDGEDAQSVIAPVAGVPEAPPPPPARTPTTLTQQCPASGTMDEPLTVSGTLAGAPAGATVTVTFQAPPLRATPGRTVPVQTTTAADGSWRASVTPGRNQGDVPGRWTIQAAYAGDAAHDGSRSAPCTVPVTDPVVIR